MSIITPLSKADLSSILSDTRLLEILDAFSNPPSVNGTEQAAEAIVDTLIDSEARAQDLGPSNGTRLNFMAESELDNDSISFENGAEFVEERAPQAPEQTIVTVEVEKVVVPAEPVSVKKQLL